MGLPDRLIGVKGDECQCGRRATVRHCTMCGSSRVYARQNKLHTLPSGEKRFVEVQFRCQACGHLFIDEEREFCNAPPISAPLARLKAQRLFEASKDNEYLSPSVIAKAQRLAGQTPNPEIEAIAQAEEASFEGTIDWSIKPEEAALIEQVQNAPKNGSWEWRKSILHEWTQAREAGGYVVPPYKEYESRRLKGETMEVILELSSGQ